MNKSSKSNPILQNMNLNNFKLRTSANTQNNNNLNANANNDNNMNTKNGNNNTNENGNNSNHNIDVNANNNSMNANVANNNNNSNTAVCIDCDTKTCATPYPTHSLDHPMPVVAFVTKLKPKLDDDMKTLIVNNQFFATDAKFGVAPSFEVLRDNEFLLIRVQFYNPLTNEPLLVKTRKLEDNTEITEPRPFDIPISVELSTQDYDNPEFFLIAVFSNGFQTWTEYLMQNLKDLHIQVVPIATREYQFNVAPNNDNENASPPTSNIDVTTIATNFSLEKVTVNEGYLFGFIPPSRANGSNNNTNDADENHSTVCKHSTACMFDLHMQKMMLIKLLHKIARPEIVDWDNDFSTMVQFCSHRILDDLKNGLDAFQTITDYFHPIFVQKTDDMQTLQKKLLFFQQQLANMQPTDADYNDTTAKIAALQISIANTNDTERLRYIFNDTCGHTLNPPARTLFEDISILFPNFKSLSVKYPQMQAFAITWQKNTAMDRFQICQVKIPNVEISAGMGQNWNVIRCQLEHEINRKFNVHVQSDNTTTMYNPS